MNLLAQFPELNISASTLTEKKQQTTKKVEYVREYVRLWALVMLERATIDTISFIDCMCNAGVYRDGDCCTAVEVMYVFSNLCAKYPQKQFRVFCNDNDPHKISILRKIVDTLPQHSNLHIHITQLDVNDYLDALNRNAPIEKNLVFSYGTAVLLYVDPFDFGTVEIPKVSDILCNHYCELIFNFFMSDYIRNIAQDHGRISKCLGGMQIATKDELIAYMLSSFRVGHIKHIFAYQFRTQTNVELYQIVFATPNIKGLEKLKEVLWDVFDGAEFHRNKVDDGQFSLFTKEDDIAARLDNYAHEAIQLLLMEPAGQELKFSQLEQLLIENTMLKPSQIITHVIKPMIDAGTLHKCGYVPKSNYKKDSYRIAERRAD